MNDIKYYKYENQFYTANHFVKALGISRYAIRKLLGNLEEFTDVTDIINKEKEALGLSIITMPEGIDMYAYKGSYMILKDISRDIGKNPTTLKWYKKRLNLTHEQMQEFIDSGFIKKSNLIHNSKVITRKDIADELGICVAKLGSVMRSRNVTNNELQDILNSSDSVSSLIDIFPELKGHLRVSINGESHVLSEASVMLGLPQNHLSNKYKQFGRDINKLQEYVDKGEYTTRKLLMIMIDREYYTLPEASLKLGLRKSHLSSKYKKLDRDLVKLQEYVDAGEFKELNMEKLTMFNGDCVSKITLADMLGLYRNTFSYGDVDMNIVNPMYCAYLKGAKTTHVYTDLFELVCPVCGRKQLVTSSEIYNFSHTESDCIGREIV